MPRNLLLFFFLIFLSCQKETKPTINIDLKSDQTIPHIFAEGPVSSALYERDLAISPDGTTIIFTRGNYKQSIRGLFQFRKTGQTWEGPTLLRFSGEYQDIEPFITPDGQQLFFASTRPVDGDSTRQDYNLWVCQKQEGEWSAPQPLPSLINTTGEEFYPSVSKNGNLYFTATREDGIGREDIFVSQNINGQYQLPVVLDSMINTAAYEFNAYIHPEESYLIFGSFGRADDLGGGDLYIAFKKPDGSWSEGKNMGAPINSEKLDYCPFVDVANGQFYFTSERMIPYPGNISSAEDLFKEANRVGNGMGDLYQMPLDSIF